MRGFFKKCRGYIYDVCEYFFDRGLFHMANSLTYKLILAIFPFLIFVMTIVSFFNIDGAMLLSQIDGYLPDVVYSIISLFVDEVIEGRNIGFLSASFAVCIFSSSSGFIPIIDGINRAYKTHDKRNGLVKRVFSVIMTFIFATMILAAAVLFVFRDQILNFIFRFIPHIGTHTNFFSGAFTIIGYGASILVIFVSIILIYKFSLGKKMNISSFLPGSLFTVTVWILFSRVFNIYINNFSKFSVIYGSIASIFIFMFWLNLLSVALLFGACINAKIYFTKQENMG